jgi:hypothetical protein
VHIRVVEEEYSSEWASMFPTFAIHKKKGTIRTATDFRKNSNQLVVETINVTLFLFQRLGNMKQSVTWMVFPLLLGFYHIKLDADSQKLCTNTKAYLWVSTLSGS